MAQVSLDTMAQYKCFSVPWQDKAGCAEVCFLSVYCGKASAFQWCFVFFYFFKLPPSCVNAQNSSFGCKSSDVDMQLVELSSME